MLVKAIHSQKAWSPIEVGCELSPNVTLVKLKHSSKAWSPIEVTLLGISMLVKLEHP